MALIENARILLMLRVREINQAYYDLNDALARTLVDDDEITRRRRKKEISDMLINLQTHAAAVIEIINSIEGYA